MKPASSPVHEPTDRWLSGPQLCRYLSISGSTLKRWRAKGLPSVGEGRGRRYHVASILAWLGRGR